MIGSSGGNELHRLYSKSTRDASRNRALVLGTNRIGARCNLCIAVPAIFEEITETGGEIFRVAESEDPFGRKIINRSRLEASREMRDRGESFSRDRWWRETRPNYRAILPTLTCSLLGRWPVTDTLDPPRALAQPMLRIPGGRSRAGPRTRTRTRTLVPHTPRPRAHDDPFLPSSSATSFGIFFHFGARRREESRIFIPCLNFSSRFLEVCIKVQFSNFSVLRLVSTCVCKIVI